MCKKWVVNWNKCRVLSGPGLQIEHWKLFLFSWDWSQFLTPSLCILGMNIMRRKVIWILYLDYTILCYIYYNANILVCKANNGPPFIILEYFFDTFITNGILTKKNKDNLIQWNVKHTLVTLRNNATGITVWKYSGMEPTGHPKQKEFTLIPSQQVQLIHFEPQLAWLTDWWIFNQWLSHFSKYPLQKTSIIGLKPQPIMDYCFVWSNKLFFDKIYSSACQSLGDMVYWWHHFDGSGPEPSVDLERLDSRLFAALEILATQPSRGRPVVRINDLRGGGRSEKSGPQLSAGGCDGCAPDPIF